MSPRRWLPPILWAAAILLLSSIPIPPAVPHAGFAGADKVVHFGLYAILGLLVTRAARDSVREGPLRARATLAALAAMSLFAAVDEWHQRFVPGRETDRFDWFADCAGATVGCALTRMTPRRREIVS